MHALRPRAQAPRKKARQGPSSRQQDKERARRSRAQADPRSRRTDPSRSPPTASASRGRRRIGLREKGESPEAREANLLWARPAVRRADSTVLTARRLTAQLGDRMIKIAIMKN